MVNDNEKKDENPYKDLKVLKKVQKEIMKRYHPDKHAAGNNHDKINNENKVEDEMNQICMTANKIYLVLSKL